MGEGGSAENEAFGAQRERQRLRGCFPTMTAAGHEIQGRGPPPHTREGGE
jgi:hypothetical protein